MITFPKRILLHFICAGFFLSFIRLDKKQNLKCDLAPDSEAISALNRSTSEQCRREIEEIACKHIKPNNYNVDSCTEDAEELMVNYKLNLERKCPVQPKWIGCCSERVLNTKFELDSILAHENVISLDRCTRICLSVHASKYAGFNQVTGDCRCLMANITDNFANLSDCDASDTDFLIYHTGFVEPNSATDEYEFLKEDDLIERFNKMAAWNRLQRVVFLLTLNGRSVRQVKRLIKAIYIDYHFYYIHVDQKQNYLRRELEETLRRTNKKNIKLTPWSEKLTWSGPSMLKLHLKAMKDLVELKRNQTWDWDFLINLSESDFPIKPIQDFTMYLKKYRENNFLAFNNSPHKLIEDQGLDEAFVECDGHVWNVGNRKMPLGVQYNGGSDWFCLKFEFIDYVLNSKHDYVKQLKSYYKNTILPSESFFHTIFLNSPFCQEYVINNNLKFINWKNDDQSCSCLFEIIDWCGCSPSYIDSDDLEKLNETTKNRTIFFARKFHPIFSSDMINLFEEKVFGKNYDKNLTSLNSYWENLYDYEDQTTNEHYRNLWQSFVDQSIENIQLTLNSPKISFSNNFNIEYLSLLDNLNKHATLMHQNQSFNLIKNVHAFFDHAQFKGFTINVEINDAEVSRSSFRFEIFYGPNYESSKFDRKKHLNSSNSTSGQFARTFQKMSLIDPGSKQAKFFENHLSVVSQESNPLLKMEFSSSNSSFVFYILWRNPSNKTVKKERATVAKYEFRQIYTGELLKPNQTKFINETGLWRILIGVKENSTSRINVILSRSFLVLPAQNKLHNNVSRANIFARWREQSICVESFENDQYEFSTQLSKFFQPCQQAEWSTYYPDPKSNLDLL